MKKVLSLVLVIAMVLSSMSFAFASDMNDIADSDYKDAINTLVGLGIVKGYEDGSFKPNNTVTRAEMAKMLVVTLGFGDLVAGSKSNFTDTQGHWADAYIALAAGKGIVLGTGNGKFAPDKTVSYNEALTMLVRGLGYTDTCNELKNMTWPTNFKVKAAELGITSGVKMVTDGADRGGIAALINNALKASLVTVDTDGNVTYLRDSATVAGIPGDLKPLLSRLAVKKGTEDRPFNVTVNMVDPKHKDYAGDKVDLKPYMYQGLQVYVNKNNEKEVVYVVKSYDNVVEGTFKANQDKDASGTTLTTANGKVNVKLADKSTKVLNITGSAVNVFYNGKEKALTEVKMENGVANETINMKNASVKVITDDNDTVKAIVAEKATYGDRIVKTYKADSLKLGRILLPTKGTGDVVDLSKVTVTGAVDDINDIKVDDIVVAYAGQGNDYRVEPSVLKLVVSRDTVEGKITETNSDEDNVTIGGKSYDVSTIPGTIGTLSVGKEGTFFLTKDGEIFAFEGSTASNAKDYAVVIQALTGEKTTVGNRITLKPEIKLINAKGEVVTYEVSTDAKYQGTTTKVLTDGAVTGTKTALDFAAIGAKTLQSASLVKYKLDAEGKISTLDIVVEDVVNVAVSKTNVDTTDKSFDVAENAPVFNVKAKSTDKNDYSVVAVKDLPKLINFKYSELNDGGAYKVIVSTNADSSTGNYALITEVGKMWNSDDENVAKITAYVNGKKVVYEAKTTGVTVTSSAIDTGSIVSLTLDNGKVSNSVVGTLAGTPKDMSIVNGISYKGANTDILTASASRMQVRNITGSTTNKEWFELDSDVVVYILNSDNEFVSVGTTDDLRGAEVVGLYNVSGDSAIDIVVIK